MSVSAGKTCIVGWETTRPASAARLDGKIESTPLHRQPTPSTVPDPGRRLAGDPGIDNFMIPHTSSSFEGQILSPKSGHSVVPVVERGDSAPRYPSMPTGGLIAERYLMVDK